MIFTLVIFLASVITMILSVLFFPKLRIGKRYFPTYVVVIVSGALIMLLSLKANLKTVISSLTGNTAVNPIKILILFLCMSGLSIFLDELGFFRYLASAVLKRAKTGQFKLFLFLYLIVSVLTVFTSNDVIILSFTPFICYFAKNAKINPIPYLAGEFVAANTWSMALVIGNPTNVYLATASGIDFISYLKVMLLPTLMVGTIAFFLLFLLYFRKLKTPVCCQPETIKIKDKPLLIIGISHLAVCTILLAVSSYINIEMWLVSLLAFLSLTVSAVIVCKVRKRHRREVVITLRRLPYELIPFILSMFVMIVALNQNGITDLIVKALGNSYPIVKFGVASFLTCNVMNNIPMSVLFSSVLSSGSSLSAIYATIIGSNLGAFFTPIGALAGIMWSNMIGKQGIKFGYLSFLKIGVLIALPTLATALFGLWIV